jgi:hypothetical protein
LIKGSRVPKAPGFCLETRLRIGPNAVSQAG